MINSSFWLPFLFENEFFSKKCQIFKKRKINPKIEKPFCRYMYTENFAQSRGQALGVQGAKLPEAPWFKPY